MTIQGENLEKDNIKIKNDNFYMIYFNSQGCPKGHEYYFVKCFFCAEVLTSLQLNFNNIVVGTLPTKFQTSAKGCSVFSEHFLKFVNSCPDLLDSILIDKNLPCQDVENLRIIRLIPEAFIDNRDSFRMCDIIQSKDYLDSNKNLSNGRTIQSIIGYRTCIATRMHQKRNDEHPKLYEQNVKFDKLKRRYGLMAGDPKTIETIRDPLESKETFKKFINEFCGFISVNKKNILNRIVHYHEADTVVKKRKRWKKLSMYITRLRKIGEFGKIDWEFRQQFKGSRQILQTYSEAKKRPSFTQHFYGDFDSPGDHDFNIEDAFFDDVE